MVSAHFSDKKLNMLYNCLNLVFLPTLWYNDPKLRIYTEFTRILGLNLS